MRCYLSSLCILATVATAQAQEGVRVIAITKENAEASAALIASAKSPLIGMPPPERRVAARSPVETGSGREQIEATRNRFENARAEFIETPVWMGGMPKRRVSVWKAAPNGGFVVQHFLVDASQP